jgi:hypothetical protein
MSDERIRKAREIARVLYAGVVTPHRSCGIAIAETFEYPSAPFQSLRRGGITGCGECGAIVAGRLVLGMMLGDPTPIGPVTPSLKTAMIQFEESMKQRLVRGNTPGSSIVCNDLTSQFDSFQSKERAAFCTDIASLVAGTVAEVALAHGFDVRVRKGFGDTEVV